jgi:hypothetical protein
MNAHGISHSDLGYCVPESEQAPQANIEGTRVPT